MIALTKETAQEMVVHLRGLASGEVLPEYTSDGLCGSFIWEFGVLIQDLVRFQNFPEYSGNKSYPIKSPNKETDPEGAYDEADNLWIGEYGAARKRFCAWCADEIENKYT